MKVIVERPVYEVKGEPLVEAWSRWGSVSTASPRLQRGRYGRITAYGVGVRLPFGYVLVAAQRRKLSPEAVEQTGTALPHV